MVLYIFTCPKCKMSEFHPALEKTMEYYFELYDLGTTKLNLLQEEPPFIPDEVVMVCENPECAHEERYTTEQIAAGLRDNLAEYVWAERKRTRSPDLFRLEDTLVQHFRNTKEITKEDLKGNAYLLRLFYEAHGNKP